MQHSFITKINIFVIIFINYIFFVFVMKCISYKNIMNYLEKIKISNISHIDLNLEKIFIYERRIAKAMKN